MTVQDARIMREAREYLVEHGWWRGHLRGPNGQQVCAVGAIIYSQGWTEFQYRNSEEESRTVDRITRKLQRLLGKMPHNKTTWSVEQWNDHPEWGGARDKQAVLDLFAKAEKIELAGFDPDEGLTRDQL